MNTNHHHSFSKLTRTLAMVLCVVSLFSVFSTLASAANKTSSYSQYTEPSGSDYAYWNGKKMVKHSGTTKSNVQWMQAMFNWFADKGYMKIDGGKLDVDGSFGPASKKACTAFQQKAGLKTDGSCGPQTISKMKAVRDELNKPAPKTNTTSNNSQGWLWPSPARRTTCGFADVNYHPSHWHRGIDICCSNNTAVYASAAGKVACVVKGDTERGNYIVIDHNNGYYSLYQHCSSILKSKGNTVKQGDVIAKSGNTGKGGYHLHFEIWKLGSAGKTINSANVPWNNWNQYVNVNPKNADKVYCTKAGGSSGFVIKEKHGSGIAAVNLQKTSKSAGSGFVYCYDPNGINYSFKG